ncbi:MAG: carboxylesterase family protein, partial [Caldimonas sp.]
MRTVLQIAILLAGFVLMPMSPVQAQPMASVPVDPTVVVTRSGPVAGVREGGSMVFRGIPYAAPPVGELRWREPREPVPWTEVRAAQSLGRACIQKPGLSEANGGAPGAIGEDCLYLNVWTPQAVVAARLPVLVWIHGGALVFGSGGVPIYDGAALAGRQAVVVTINYRLGPLGFFVHPSLGNGGSRAVANFGLLDQVEALHWVKRNIAAFGGDPGEVTIFGQSAGAESVLALYASPLARGLFARGIAQSPYGIPGHRLAQASANGIGIAARLGLPGAEATAAALRAVPAESFAGLDGPGLSLAPAFVIGDRALPDSILGAFQRGTEAMLPLVVGSTSDDSSVAVAFGIDPAALVKKLGAARIAVRTLYPRDTDDAELGRQVVRDVVFTTFAKRIAWLHAERAPTWRYFFDYVAEGRR